MQQIGDEYPQVGSQISVKKVLILVKAAVKWITPKWKASHEKEYGRIWNIAGYQVIY